MRLCYKMLNDNQSIRVCVSVCVRACHTTRMRNVNDELQRTHLKILDPKK